MMITALGLGWVGGAEPQGPTSCSPRMKLVGVCSDWDSRPRTGNEGLPQSDPFWRWGRLTWERSAPLPVLQIPSGHPAVSLAPPGALENDSERKEGREVGMK